MNLSKHFKLAEFTRSETAKKQGISNEATENAVKNLTHLCYHVLEPIREIAGSQIIVTSGYRCKALNRAVGGVDKSQHLCLGKSAAADIICPKLTVKELFQLIIANREVIPFDQVINEFGRWVHISYKRPTQRIMKANKNNGKILYDVIYPAS